jgi:hypothetical protein
MCGRRAAEPIFVRRLVSTVAFQIIQHHSLPPDEVLALLGTRMRAIAAADVPESLRYNVFERVAMYGRSNRFRIRLERVWSVGLIVPSIEGRLVPVPGGGTKVEARVGVWTAASWVVPVVLAAVAAVLVWWRPMLAAGCLGWGVFGALVDLIHDRRITYTASDEARFMADQLTRALREGGADDGTVPAQAGA